MKVIGFSFARSAMEIEGETKGPLERINKGRRLKKLAVQDDEEEQINEEKSKKEEQLPLSDLNSKKTKKDQKKDKTPKKSGRPFEVPFEESDNFKVDSSHYSLF